MSSWLMATTVVRTLLAAGVSDVVLAPGSRSAALAVALEQAERAGALRVHVRVDERVAGFLALGLAKASGRPVPVITTSGTAVGNLLPAAMEARHAGVPWLAITCDRPAYRVGTGASQTTDQAGLFGVFAVANVRLSSSSGRPAYWAAGINRAVAAATGVRTRRPGPAQVNLEFSNPMLPPADQFAKKWLVDQPFLSKLTSSASGEVVELPAGPRTVVLVGDASVAVGAEARAFAEVNRLPLLAEPSSNARTGPNAIASYRLLLDGVLRSEIERVVTFGHPTLSRPVAALLSDPSVEQVVVASGADWPDVGATASQVCDRVVMTEPSPDAWLTRWQDADRHVMTALAERLTGLSGYTLASAVVGSATAGNNVVFGSSNPIRDADIAPVNPRPATCWANRGLAGIDGTIATATGIALATGRPTTLLLGDLTFQHDVGALAIAPAERHPDLRIVVADDGGGSIFHTLEQGAAAYAESFERVFATPQGLDLVAVATSFGIPAHRVDSAAQLASALAQPISGIEVLVVSIGRSDRRATDRALRSLGSEETP